MFCPLWRRDVSKVCHTCEWYVHLIGTNPQTEERIDDWGCSIGFMPTLQIETTQQQRQAGASSDKVANEVAKFHDTMSRSNAHNATLTLALLNGNSDPRMIESDDYHKG